MGRLIVLDTNCLVQCFSRRSQYYRVWEDFIEGKYTLCVSSEILSEYEEIISTHSSPLAAKLVVETILRANNVLRIDAHFHFGLIIQDDDDNKFVDCAVAANAEYIVTEDRHFDILSTIPFPHVEVKRLHEFYKELTQPLGN